MSFGVIQFTNRGRALQAKAQAGAQLIFTRIAVGDGQLAGQAISDLTALIHLVKSLTINKFKTMPGGKAAAGGVLSNQEIVTGFWWREIGLFAMDPDLGEILYCYGNAGELAEYIPSPGGAEILEKQVDIVTIVGNAGSISATIEQSLVYASAQELIEHEADTDAHGIGGKISKSLATGADQVLVSSGAGTWITKTMTQFRSWLGLGSAAYTDSNAYATASQGAKADNAIPLAQKGTAGGVALYDTVSSHMSEIAILVPQSGSTANAINLNILLTDKKKGSFKASATNTDSMTINGKGFKKDASTQISAGGVKAGKVYDFYYDQAADSVFILAKASGNAQPSQVLAPFTFSNDDGEQSGTMADYGNSEPDSIVAPYMYNDYAYMRPPSGRFSGGAGSNVKYYAPDCASENIISGKNIFGIAGTAKKIPNMSVGTNIIYQAPYALSASPSDYNWKTVMSWAFKVPGGYRFSYSFYIAQANASASIRVTKNGANFGPVHTEIGGTGNKYYIDDLTGIVAGDVIAIMVKHNESTAGGLSVGDLTIKVESNIYW